MFLLIISVMFFASGCSSQVGETERCDTSELKLCVKIIPPTPVGLPRNKAELDAHCRWARASSRIAREIKPESTTLAQCLKKIKAYQTGMSCMDAWIRRCLPTDGQKFVQQQIGGARALMRYLCANDTALRREFLKEQSCWARVSPHWTACVDELQIAVKDITERSQHLAYFNKNAELCCAREEFMYCVGDAGRICTTSAGTLLQRMAWVLAQDVATCSPPRARCNAPSPHTVKITATLLAVLPVVQYL